MNAAKLRTHERLLRANSVEKLAVFVERKPFPLGNTQGMIQQVNDK